MFYLLTFEGTPFYIADKKYRVAHKIAQIQKNGEALSSYEVWTADRNGNLRQKDLSWLFLDEHGRSDPITQNYFK